MGSGRPLDGVEYNTQTALHAANAARDAALFARREGPDRGKLERGRTASKGERCAGGLPSGGAREPGPRLSAAHCGEPSGLQRGSGGAALTAERLCDDRIAQHADSLDLDLDDVP